jgi:type III pantothenate kinase
VLRIVADLGNSRLKLGSLGPSGALERVVALPAGDPASWQATWSDWNPGNALASSWAISSVNPPAAALLRTFLGERGIGQATWYRSAAEVGVRHALDQAETAGADRALAVAAAVSSSPVGRPGLVALCGTAVTVERVSADGVWLGGAIAAGLGLTARALHMLTAQLPLVSPQEAPPSWGNATRPALEAGVYWGVVGAIRELLTRQSKGLEPTPWLVWSGGDAEALAPAIPWEGARVVPDLVLEGLARVGFDPASGLGR